MRDTYRILASDREEILKEQRKTRRKVFVAVFISLFFFTYPLVKSYSPSNRSLKAARKFAQYVSMLRTQAITKKTAIEMQIVLPDMIEVYEGSSCTSEVPMKKLWEISLSTFEPGLVFLNDEWAEKNIQNAPQVIKRICYDYLKGSYLSNDLSTINPGGFGSVFIGDSNLIQNYQDNDLFEPFSEVQISGITEDIQIQ